MPLSTNISVWRGSTGATMTGGSVVTFVNDGQAPIGKRVLVDSSVSDPALRHKIITAVALGSIQQNGNAKLHRTQVTVQQPFVASNGANYPLGDNLNMSYHPEMTDAQREAKFWNTIAILVDAELQQIQKKLIND